jgi:hypothetical protein
VVALAMILGTTGALIDAGAGGAKVRYAAGTYTATFPDSSAASTLVVTNATGSTSSGTFELTEFGDFGTWVAQGNTVAFLVSASSAGHEGSVLIAKLSATGLAPGELGPPGEAEQPWSATRVESVATPAPSGAATNGIARAAAAKPVHYDAVFDGSVDDTLTTVHYQGTPKAGIFALTNLQDLGVWAKLGKQIVLGITNGEDAGIVLLGTQSPSAISTMGAPGVYYQESTGVHPWYATKRVT